MKKVLLIMVAAFFLFGGTGCMVVEEKEAFADSFPDKYWENIWVIEERNTEITIDGEQVIMDGYSVINYKGDKPAEDVTIIIRSPLTYDFIEDGMAQTFGTVEPGEKLEYELHAMYYDWQENVPAYILEDKLMDDFRKNFYVGINWRYGDEQYKKRFHDWSGGKY